MEKYPEIFGDSSENEVEMETEVATTMETEVESKHDINREEKLREVEEKLLSKIAVERFTDYDGIMYDSNLPLTEKIIHLQKQLMMQQEERFTGLRYKEDYLKNVFVNQRKFMKRLWWKQRLQDGGRDSYENCTNLF